MSARIPPQDLDAEMGLLGSVLIDVDAADVLLALPENAFYKESHRMLYRAIRDITMASEPIDLIVVTDHLRRAGTLPKIGGAPYLLGLMEQTPLAANAASYARVVLEKHHARETIRVAGTAMQQAYDGLPVGDVLGQLEHGLTTLVRFDNAERGPQEYRADALELISGVGGLSTSFVDLDAVTGGLVKGGYNVIAARPSMGKSSVLRSILQHRVSEGDRVALFSVDQSGGEIYALAASAKLQTSLSDFRANQRGHRQATEAQLQAFESRLARIATEWDDRLVVHDSVSDAARILHIARREIRAGATVIAVDHLQSLSLAGRTDDTGTVSNISRMFKSLSREFNVTVILLSQLGRDVENNPGKIPGLRNLRQSGAIEEDANQVLFLHRPEYYSALEGMKGDIPRQGEMDVIVAKNKLGSVPHTVVLSWLGSYAVAGNYGGGSRHEQQAAEYEARYGH